MNPIVPAADGRTRSLAGWTLAVVALHAALLTMSGDLRARLTSSAVTPVTPVTVLRDATIRVRAVSAVSAASTEGTASRGADAAPSPASGNVVFESKPQRAQVLRTSNAIKTIANGDSSGDPLRPATAPTRSGSDAAPAAVAAAATSAATSASDGRLDSLATKRAPPTVAAAATIAAAVAPTAAIDAEPAVRAAHRLAAPATWRYAVRGERRGRAWEGASRIEWRHDGAAYDAAWTTEQDAAPPTMQTQTLRSVGRLDAGGLVPERFSVRARGETATHFMGGDGEIHFSANRPPVALKDGAQDRLSVLLQLGARLAGDASVRTAGTTFAVQTAGARGAGMWNFRVEPGAETPTEDTAAMTGAHVADPASIHLVRVAQGPYEPLLEAWFSPRLDYAPVRVRLTLANGDWTEHRWSGTDRH